MSRSSSSSMKEEVFGQTTGEVYATLITLDHDDLDEPLRLASDLKDTLSNGSKGIISQTREFIFFPFELIPPGEDGERVPTGKLRMDNVSREIILAVREISSPVDVTIEIVRVSDPDTIEVLISGFQLRNIRGDALTVEGELSTTQFDLEPFPSGRFTASSFPGLFE